MYLVLKGLMGQMSSIIYGPEPICICRPVSNLIHYNAVNSHVPSVCMDAAWGDIITDIESKECYTGVRRIYSALT